MVKNSAFCVSRRRGAVNGSSSRPGSAASITFSHLALPGSDVPGASLLPTGGLVQLEESQRQVLGPSWRTGAIRSESREDPRR